MEASLKSIGRVNACITNGKKKAGAILSVDLRHSRGAVYAHPSCDSHSFIMPFKIVGCIARQGTGRELQSHCKPRGNPRADDWIFLFYSQVVTVCPNFSNFTMLCPIVFMVLTHFCVFSFRFSWEPHCFNSCPFQLSLLCGSSPLLPQFWSHLCAFWQHLEASQSQSSKEIPEKKGYPGLCICRLKPSF